MGRILDALKHPESRCGDAEGVSPTLHRPGQAEPTPPADENEETVSFIEIGPQRSMEGSPDVLASIPRKEAARPRQEKVELKPVFLGPRLVGEPADPAPAPSPAARSPEVGATELLRTEPHGLRGPRFGAELIAYHQPQHALSQQYVRLIQPLLAPSVQGRSRVLLFSSARPGSGTTTVLLNLAITAARHGRKRVVVVDGNLRRPALAERLGLGETAGLRDVLSGELPLEQALQETDQINLYALPAGKALPIQGIRYLAETVRSLLRQLRQRYDLVLVDGPRWDGQPDVVVLGLACDAVYLVVSEKEVESTQVDELYQSIPVQGARLAGCILV